MATVEGCFLFHSGQLHQVTFFYSLSVYKVEWKWLDEGIPNLVEAKAFFFFFFSNAESAISQFKELGHFPRSSDFQAPLRIFPEVLIKCMIQFPLAPGISRSVVLGQIKELQT